MESITVSQFKGGLTENFIGAPENMWERCDNLIITNDFKLKSRPGRQLIYTSSTDARVDLNNVGDYRISALIPYRTTSDTNSFLRQSGERIFQDSSGMTEILGPASNHALNSITASTDLCSFSTWRHHTFVACDKYQKPVEIFPSTSMRLITAGLPRPPNATTGTLLDLNTSAATNPFIIAFVYKYTYTVNGVTFVRRSAPRYMRRAAAGTTPTHDITPAQLNTFKLANASNQEHYDVADVFGTMKIEYYRTTNAGTVLYYVGESSNGTTTTITEVSDANLVFNEPLYTTGGDAENYRPPKCKYVHVTNDFGYYANGKEVQVSSDSDGQTFTNRIWQSKSGLIDAVPADFYVDVDEEIIGLSSVRSVPIVFTRRAVYRIDNGYDDSGRGGMNIVKITDFTGGVSNLSCIQTLDKLLFAGADGFYITDGYTVNRISDLFTEHYKDTFNTEAKQKKIYGVYDERNAQVLWAAPEFDETSDNNIIYVYNLIGEAFTTWSSGSNISRGVSTRYAEMDSNFQPTALLSQEGIIYMGDALGYTTKFTLDYRTDPHIDENVSDVSLWKTVPIIYDYISSSWDNNIPAVRKYGTGIVVKFNPIFGNDGSNSTVQLSTDCDNSQQMLDCAEIYTNNLLFWGDSTLLWGDDTLYWNVGNKVSQHGRKFPASRLRYSYRKVGITNAFVNILNSDKYTTVEGRCYIVNATSTTATFQINDGTESFALSDPIGYFMTIDSDNYTREYRIIDFSTDRKTITVEKTTSVTFDETGLHKWIVKGFRKDDILVLLEWTCNFVPMSQTYSQFRAVTGTNV